MKKWIFTLLTVVVVTMNSQVQAQTIRTIEVVVKDTVFLKATKITYLLTLDPYMYNWDESYEEYYDEDYYMEEMYYNDQEKKKKKCKKNRNKNNTEIVEVYPVENSIDITEKALSVIEEIHYLTKEEMIVLMDSLQFKYESGDYKNYVLGTAESVTNFLVTLNSEVELKRLFDFFSTHPEVSGSINKIEYESAQPKMLGMYKKMYDTAYKEAQEIAKISGLTLNKLMKVSENKSEYGSYFDSYTEIMQSFNLGFKSSKDLSGKNEIVERVFVFDAK